MSRSRSLVYKIGRVTVIVASLAGPALAQDAPLPPPNPDAPAAPADAAPPPPPAPAPSPDITALQTRLQALEQRTQTLETERAQLLAAPVLVAKPAATVTADESGFALTSADKQFQFRLKGNSRSTVAASSTRWRWRTATPSWFGARAPSSPVRCSG